MNASRAILCWSPRPPHWREVPFPPLSIPEMAPSRWPDAAALLFDRDGTLVHDVPYNGDPSAVAPVDGVRQALDDARREGLAVGVVTNQSGVGRGLLTLDEVSAVNDRIEALLGPFATWMVCPHVDSDGCVCRKPAPGLVLAAAAEIGVDANRCVVIGDRAADAEAGHRAGARSVLVGRYSVDQAVSIVLAGDFPD